MNIEDMQTYSSKKPQFWKKKYDDVFDTVAAPRGKHLLVESWLRQLPDIPDIPQLSVNSESSIEILRKAQYPSNLEKKPSTSSIGDLIDADYQATKKKCNTGKSQHPYSCKTARNRLKCSIPVPSVSTLTSTPITESVTNTDPTVTKDPTGTTGIDFEETDNTETSYTYTWVTASTTNSSASKSSGDVSQLKKLRLADYSPTVHLKTVKKKKVLNSTAKINAKSLESVDFSQNISPIVNSDIQYDAVRQQLFEESTPHRSRESHAHRDICQSQKELQKKAKKPLSSTAIYLSGVDIEERFHSISSINIDGSVVKGGVGQVTENTGSSDKAQKQKRGHDFPVILGDNEIIHHKKVKVPKCALTSTPTSKATKKPLPTLNIDLSSLGSASLGSDDIILLRKSDDEVNSEEIVAETYIDNDVEMPDVQDICIGSSNEKNTATNDDRPKTPVPVISEKVTCKVFKNPKKTIKGKPRKGKRQKNDIKSVSGHKSISRKRCPKISTNIIVNKPLLVAKRSNISICPLSIVQPEPKTKPTNLVYIRPATKEFWDMVKTFPIDPLTTLKCPVSKMKNKPRKK